MQPHADSPQEAPYRRVWTPATLVATGLGIGFFAPAPGTIGGLWGLAWAWALLSAGEWAWWSLPFGLAMGIPLCTQASRDLGARKDPQCIVWDEIATVPLVFVLTPRATVIQLLLGFALHRAFDITKPWPCRRLEQLPAGLGIMADDVMAALYAAVLLRVACNWI